MKINSIKIGDKLQGKVEEDLEKPFVGVVEKIYTNSALLTITEFDPADANNVSELNNKVVVSASGLKKIAKKK